MLGTSSPRSCCNKPTGILRFARRCPCSLSPDLSLALAFQAAIRVRDGGVRVLQDGGDATRDAHMLRFWCHYWISVAMVIAFESLISWMPMYGEIKLAFFVYLWYPKTKGSDVCI